MNKPITTERRESLHALIDRLEAASQVDEETGELTPEAAAALDELNEVSLPDKIDAYYCVIAQKEARATANKALAQEYGDRSDSASAAAEALEQRLMAELGRVGLTRVEGKVATFTVQASPPRLKLVDGFDIEQAPEEYVETEKRLKKRALMEAIKAGREFVFASIERNFHVRWR